MTQKNSNQRTYLCDSDEIYRQSFATIATEVNLDSYDPLIRPVLLRLIHACGMTDIIDKIVVHPDWFMAVRKALSAGKIFCDSNMTKVGIIERHLPVGSHIECLLSSAETKNYAKEHGLTLSAASLAIYSRDWRDAIIVIGNAPTALYEFLYQLDYCLHKPAALIAFPVGFVGAVESKDQLINAKIDIPFITLRGRLGGSAMAAAALNAVLIENGAING